MPGNDNDPLAEFVERLRLLVADPDRARYPEFPNNDTMLRADAALLRASEALFSLVRSPDGLRQRLLREAVEALEEAEHAAAEARDAIRQAERGT